MPFLLRGTECYTSLPLSNLFLDWVSHPIVAVPQPGCLISKEDSSEWVWGHSHALMDRMPIAAMGAVNVHVVETRRGLATII